MIDFEFNEYQELLRNGAREFMVETCPTSLVREMETDEKGYSAEIWKEMGELGWLGLCLPEELGGADGTFVDLAILLEEAGRVLLPSPIHPSIVLGALSILHVGSEKQRNELLSKISEGKIIITFALNEPGSWYGLKGINATCFEEGNAYRVRGQKLFVPYAHIADYIICVAKDSQGNLGMYLIESDADKIRKTFLENTASEKLFEVVFEDVRISKENKIGDGTQGENDIEKLLQFAAVAKCAEMIGGARTVKEMCIEYSKQRVQFGKPIGSFQAIQHHIANIAIDLEGARLVTYRAAWLLSEGIKCEKEVAVAKAWTNEAYKRIVCLGHQIHGGYSITTDHDVQLYFRRAKAAELAYGDTNYFLNKLAHVVL